MEKLQQVELNEDDFRAQVGARIRKRRQDLKASLTDMATATGLARSTICKIELGQMNIDVARVQLFASAFGVPAEELLGEGVGVASQN